MKKKEVKYSPQVPQSIVDYMGNQPYQYIKRYNTTYWQNSTLELPEILNPTELKRYSIEGIFTSGDSIQSMIESLQQLLQNEDIVESWLDRNYDYYGHSDDICIHVKRVLTGKELEKYCAVKEVYDLEATTFEGLQKIIKTEIKNIEKQFKAAAKEAVKLKIQNMEKELEKLKAKL